MIQNSPIQHGWQQQLSDPYHGTGGNGANHGVKHGAQQIDPMLLLDPTFGTNSHHNAGQAFMGPAQGVGYGPGSTGTLNIGDLAGQGGPQIAPPKTGNPMLNMLMMMMQMMMKMLGMGPKPEPMPEPMPRCGNEVSLAVQPKNVAHAQA